MKKILVRTFLGIAWGCTVNCIVCLIIAFINGNISFTANEFLIQLTASSIAGIGFTLPTIVYKSERLSQGIKILIHLGIGFVIYFPTAFLAGWIPKEAGILTVILFTAIAVAAFFVIYFFFLLYHKSEAKNMNRKIEEKLR